MALNSYVLVKKSDSYLMGILNLFVALFNNRFMTFYWTTINRTIYVPTMYNNDEDWGSVEWKARHFQILYHEAIHVSQFDRQGFLHNILYLGPSVVVLPFAFLIGVLALWLPLTLPFLVFLALGVMLLPLSIGFAYWRKEKELEAYLPELLTVRHSNEAWVRYRIGRIADLLWSDYFFTWPRSWLEKELYERVYGQTRSASR